MNRSLALAWLEAKSLWRYPASPLVISLFVGCALLSAAEALRTDVDTLAGEATRWAAFRGPWLQVGLALLAVYAGAAGVTRYRGEGDDPWRVLPVAREQLMLGRLLGRLLFVGLLALLVTVPLGIVVGSEMMPAGARPGVLLPAVIPALSTLLLLGYVVSGTFLLAVLLPRGWHAMVLGTALCGIWAGLAWVYPYSGYDVPDELLFWGMNGLNPFWLDRLAGLGFVALAPLLGVVVGTLAHTWMALSCEHRVAFEYNPKREQSELTWKVWPLAVRLLGGHVVIIAVAIGGTMLLGLHGLDTSRARVTEPGANAAQAGPLLAQTDPLSRLDAPLQAIYLWRLAQAQPEGALKSIWRPAAGRDWQGLIRFDVEAPLGLDVAPQRGRTLSVEIVERFNERYRQRAAARYPDVALPAADDVQATVEPAPGSMRAHLLGLSEARLVAQGQRRPRVLLVGQAHAVGWLMLLRSEGYPVATVSASAADTVIGEAEPSETLVLLSLQGGNKLPPEGRAALMRFHRGGGAVLVSLRAPLPPREESPDAPDAGAAPRTQLAGVLPAATDSLAELIDRWGLRMAYAPWDVAGISEASATRQGVRVPLTDGKVRWRMVAGHEVLQSRRQRGSDTSVQAVAQPVALKPARLPGGSLATEALPWRPLVQATDERVTQRHAGEPLALPPSPVWWRAASAERGPVAVSALEPFTGEDSRYGLRPRNGDERDLTVNLLARLAERSEPAHTLRRKPLSLGHVDDWQPGDWVALLAASAYSIPLIGLILGARRLRKKRRRKAK